MRTDFYTPVLSDAQRALEAPQPIQSVTTDAGRVDVYRDGSVVYRPLTGEPFLANGLAIV